MIEEQFKKENIQKTFKEKFQDKDKYSSSYKRDEYFRAATQILKNKS